MKKVSRVMVCLLYSAGIWLGWGGKAGASINPEELPQVGYHPSGVEYYAPVFFANALFMESRGWRLMKPKPGGQSWETITVDPEPGQVDSLGNPVYLLPGDKLFAHPGQNGNDNALFAGRVVLTWRGAADIRVQNGTFIPNGQNTADQPQSSGPATGMLLNGTRVYDLGSNPNGAWVMIHAISEDPSLKPSSIRLWLSDPDTGKSLIGQTFHPKVLKLLNDRPWGYIRFMDWNPTNASPQQDWVDRRRPNHTFQMGVINPRSAAPGVVMYYDSQGQPVYFPGNQSTGVAFEYMVALCNATRKHMWITVPHLATDDFVTNLARLIRYGADANGNPYTSEVSNPVWAPLNRDLKVFVEYSNEIWSNGYSFPQGDWARVQGQALGLTPDPQARFNARRFCQVWRLFENVFGSSDRLVKVAAIFTGSEHYTRNFLQEIKAYGPTLSPPQEPDVISPTTYFGNGIQDWAHQRATQQAGTADEWFYSNVDWDHDNNPNTPPRKESKPLTDPYWNSAAFQRHMNEAFDEWTRRQLSDSSIRGGGFDATGIGGGFDYWLRTMAQTMFPTPKPIVAYEGGPSLYTDYMDHGDPRDDGITNFIVAMNRHLRIKEVYRTHLHMAKAKGLWSHMMFVDAGTPGKYGQWGHLERFSQDPTTAPKYVFMREWFDIDTNGLRHIDRPQGAVPSFVTPASLPEGYVGAPYHQTVTTTGGDGTRTVQIISKYLLPGLVATASGSGLTVSGTPTAAGSSYVYALVKDSNGDPAWRTFTIRTVARSTDPAVTIDFEGETNTYATYTPEPLDISGYRFTSFGNDGGRALQIHGVGDLWMNWASKVLFSKHWGSRHRIARADGRTFDLFDLQVASSQARSVKIIGFAPGGIRMERIVNIPLQDKPMTTVSLDWITLEKVEVVWYENENATGNERRGAIDNLRFNTGTGVPGGGSGGGTGLSQTVNRDYWTGISGTMITTLTTNANYPNNATGRDTLTSLQAVNWANPSQTSNWADNYGQRIRGYLVAPATGSYTFWISGDDDCEFWLSTDANPANRVRLAHITNGWTTPLQWDKYASQKSAPVNLVQGQRYYLEILHKEGGGGDSVAVGWARPGQPTTAPSEVVPGSVLDAFVPEGNPPNPTPTSPPFSVKVNFQRATTVTPDGYVADIGQTFGSRSNGLTYGWSVDKTNRVRERGVDPDKRRDTLVHFDTPDVRWEIEVPNGTYSYTIVCGDPSFNDQVNNLQIENVTLTDTNGTAVGFDTYTGTVTVSDGRLTLRMASGGSNAKICYIDLAQQ
jgi:hypothetical protein